jgi:hypothetical protein
MPKFSPAAGCGCCRDYPAWTVYHSNVSEKLHYYAIDFMPFGSLSFSTSMYGLLTYDRMESGNYVYSLCNNINTGLLTGLPAAGTNIFSGNVAFCELHLNRLSYSVTGAVTGGWIKAARIEKFVLQGSFTGLLGHSDGSPKDFSSELTYNEGLPLYTMGRGYRGHHNSDSVFSGALTISSGATISGFSAMAVIGGGLTNAYNLNRSVINVNHNGSVYESYVSQYGDMGYPSFTNGTSPHLNLGVGSGIVGPYDYDGDYYIQYVKNQPGTSSPASMNVLHNCSYFIPFGGFCADYRIGMYYQEGTQETDYIKIFQLNMHMPIDGIATSFFDSYTGFSRNYSLINFASLMTKMAPALGSIYLPNNGFVYNELLRSYNSYRINGVIETSYFRNDISTYKKWVGCFDTSGFAYSVNPYIYYYALPSVVQSDLASAILVAEKPILGVLGTELVNNYRDYILQGITEFCWAGSIQAPTTQFYTLYDTSNVEIAMGIMKIDSNRHIVDPLTINDYFEPTLTTNLRINTMDGTGTAPVTTNDYNGYIGGCSALVPFSGVGIPTGVPTKLDIGFSDSLTYADIQFPCSAGTYSACYGDTGVAYASYFCGTGAGPGGGGVAGFANFLAPYEATLDINISQIPLSSLTLTNLAVFSGDLCSA